MRIIYIVKVVECEEYAEDVLNGRLFFNRLSYYKKREDSHSGRFDRTEGSILYQGDSVRLELAGHEVGDDLISMSIQPDIYQRHLLFCMFAGHTGMFGDEIDEREIASFRKQIGFPGERLRREMGPFTIAFRDPNDLMRRIRTAAHEKGFVVERRLVKYYDPDRDNVPENPVFHKPHSYSYQQEYRIALHSNPLDDNDDPLCLDIGDMRHNAIPMETEKVDRSLGMTDSSGNKIF